MTPIHAKHTHPSHTNRKLTFIFLSSRTPLIIDKTSAVGRGGLAGLRGNPFAGLGGDTSVPLVTLPLLLPGLASSNF